MGWFRKSDTANFKWEDLDSMDDLENYISQSDEKLIAIFKHSTRCSISSMAKSRFERNWNLDNSKITPVYLDLIAHRNISNELAERFKVTHESPQLLLIKNGECIFNTSHNDISAEKLADFIS